jgi:L-ribulose-5-phosphate 3-epimerase
MRRRAFLKAAITAAIVQSSGFAAPASGLGSAASGVPGAAKPAEAQKPMALGLMIHLGSDPEAAIARVKELGLPTCFLSLDGYIGKFNVRLADEIRGLLDKYGVTATSAEVVGPGRLVWDFLDGPSTIGLVPRETRAARIDALKETSDFVKAVSRLVGSLAKAILALSSVAISRDFGTSSSGRAITNPSRSRAAAIADNPATPLPRKSRIKTVSA